MATTQTKTTCADLEEMNNEQFLAWMLNNCAMDEQEENVAWFDVIRFFMRMRDVTGLEYEPVEKRYPNLKAWVEKGIEIR